MLRVVPFRVSRAGCRWYRISTLNRTRLLPTDCVPFKALNDVTLGDQASAIFLPQHKMQKISDPSPCGFLYLHQPEGGPSTVQELRFRVVDSPIPFSNDEDIQSLFLQGKDLVLKNNAHFSLPLYKIVKTPSLAPIKELLLESGCITEELVERIARIFSNLFSEPSSSSSEEGTILSPISPSNTIYKLNQPFPLIVQKNKATLFLVSEDQVVDLNIGMGWLGYPDKRKRVFRGAAIAVIDRVPSHSSPSLSEEGFFSPSPTTSSFHPSQPSLSQSSLRSIPSFTPSPYLPASLLPHSHVSSSPSPPLTSTSSTPTSDPQSQPHSQPQHQPIKVHPNALDPYILRLVRLPKPAPKPFLLGHWRRMGREKKEKERQEQEGQRQCAMTDGSEDVGMDRELQVEQEYEREQTVLGSRTLSYSSPTSSPSHSTEANENEGQIETPLARHESEERQKHFYASYLELGHSAPLRAFSYSIEQSKLADVVRKTLG
ncbi:hypothetical protein K435DRAFT_968695 [Dendrothele bispora CBS 962.96]|uniref:Uncharacterized protein n=1 Tax=Dendrothele bispora (strain CBS 962.96) TaxID=1314807 RepID=A0A4S8LM50_DENBC|nr:hypothetical protein K435DRAFT_968695 [Dendrothele bispora CBS 962.96]